MELKNYSILGLFILPFILLACNKNEAPSSQARMWDCHHEMTWDSLSTREALVGKWEWEYVECYGNPEEANGDEFKGLVVEFKLDNLLEVKENGQATQTSNWKVVDGDGDLFAVEVDPPVNQLYGRILFCGERVKFNNSYIDGCDNDFEKRE